MDPTQAAGASPADLSALLERLLDEAEEGGVSGTPPPAESPPAEAAVPVAAPTPTPPLPPVSPVGGAPAGGPLGGPMGRPMGGSPLGGLLANPALLAALPTLAENLGPLLGSLSGGTGTAPAATRPHTVDRHTALLCAVKPYLSPGRQNAAETIIRLCRVWDALERSGISLTGLLGGLGGAVPAASAKTDGEVT